MGPRTARHASFPAVPPPSVLRTTPRSFPPHCHACPSLQLATSSSVRLIVFLTSFRALHVMLSQTNAAPIGDQPLGEFLHVAGLLVPLYAGRAAEVALFGKDGASLATGGCAASSKAGRGWWPVSRCLPHLLHASVLIPNFAQDPLMRSQW